MSWLDKTKAFLGVTLKDKSLAKTRLSEQLLNSGNLGLTNQEEVDIFSLLVNKFLSPIIRVEGIQAVPQSEELKAKKVDFASSESYKNLESFVKQHSLIYSNENLLALKYSLQKDNNSFNNDELRSLINEENKKQEYTVFKKIMLVSSPKDFAEYLKRFIIVYGKQIKLLDDWRIAQLISKETPNSEESVKELEKRYIDVGTLQDILPSDEKNSLPRFRSIARKASLIYFFNKLLSDEKVQYNETTMDKLIDLIVTEKDKQQSETDSLIQDIAAVLWAEFMETTSLTLNPTDLYRESYEKIKLSDFYKYLVNFVRKYSSNYADYDVGKLCELFRNKNIHLSKSELKLIIGTETGNQIYLNFKKPFEKSEITSLQDVLKTYVTIYNKELKDLQFYINEYKEYGFVEDEDGNSFINHEFKDTNGDSYYIYWKQLHNIQTQNSEHIRYLKRFISENRIPFVYNNQHIDNKEFVKHIFDMRKSTELEHFEQTLQGDTCYSIEDVDLLSGYEFESFLKKLFENMGYLIEQTKLSGDQGADLLARKMSETTVIQAKRYSSSIGNSAIQEVVASIGHYKADKGMVITNSEFTSAAIQLAKSNKIDLIDRKKLSRLIKEYL